ncbi:MAG: hypothetical protein K8R58_09230, partial [Bacteroidales bacterium]|nr:hypothetical protein [Bacteroidales bacterium]
MPALLTCFKKVDYKISTSFFLLIILVFSACRKERPHPSWDVDLLVPLFYDTVTITDLINDTLMEENPDHSITFIFEQQLYEVKVDSLVMLPDTIFSFSFHLYYPYTAQPGENLLHEHFDHALDF